MHMHMHSFSLFPKRQTHFHFHSNTRLNNTTAQMSKAEELFNIGSDDGSDNEGSGSGYDSEEAAPTKKSSTATKTKNNKKKATFVSFGDDDEDDDDDEGDNEEEEDDDDNEQTENNNEEDEEEEGEVEGESSSSTKDSRFIIDPADLHYTDFDDDEDEDEEDEDLKNPKHPLSIIQAKKLRLRHQQRAEKRAAAAAAADAGEEPTGKGEARKKVKPLTPEALAKFQAAHEKTGIVYLSRIPPFMKPIKLRHLLGQFGELGRIYLAPEDAKIAARRKKYGGNKKQNFTEGWVEFADKSVAKQVAKSLNATIIGGKKNSFYHDDMWNIKYLSKFKWNHLTERIAYENASKAQRLQAEINQAKRENKFILGNVEKAKMITNMEEKKAAKRKASAGESGATTASGSTSASTPAPQGSTTEKRSEGIRRAFKQRKLDTPATMKLALDGKIKGVLGNVFGK